MNPESKRALQKFALQIRIGTIEAIKSRGFGHMGGSLSIADLLSVLYGGEMRIDPKNPAWPERDKLVCSKGHAGPAVYAALALKGYFPYEELSTLNQPGTHLPSHCDRKMTPGVDMTTGSLGQGASLAVGMAIGDKLKGRDSRIFLITGDGEAGEGQIWEAAMLANARGLDNLYWFVDDNKKQLDGPTEEILPQLDLAEKFAAFGFDAVRINGGSVCAIKEAIARAGVMRGRAHAIILDTIKGAGVKELEKTASNHSTAVSKEVYDRWLSDLRQELAACGA